MKIRNGFVSNSSSSSFVVAVSPDSDLKTELEKFKVSDDSNPFVEVANEIVDWIIGSVDIYDDEDLKYELDEDYLSENIKQAHFHGWKLYRGCASDGCCDDGVEGIVCNMTIDINNDNLIIEKEGGY